MADDLPQLGLTLLLGLLLGAVFYGGLWLTAKHVVTSRHPAVWLVCSFLARTAIVLAGLLWLLSSDWRRPIVFVAGFMVARLLVVLQVRDVSADVRRERRT